MRRHHLALALLVCLAPALTAQEVPPELRFEAPAELEAVRARLADLDPATFLPTMALLGLHEPGPPIRVVLAPEGSPEAERAPSWAAGYAVGNASLIVLMPARTPSYPDDDLEAVLRHEVAHVLVARASGGRPVPRWLNEGLAMVAGREWGLDDRSRLIVAAFATEELDLAELDRGFAGGPASAARSYALSGAFVRWLIREHGRWVVARILDRLAADASFDDAFRRSTGTPLGLAQLGFRNHLTFWDKWVPLVASSTSVWLGISLLALWAFHRRRQRDREMVEQWKQEEEQELQEALERLELPPGGWVH